MENGHLSIEQIEDLSLSDEPATGEPPGAWSHIGRCEECRSLVEEYRLVHARFTELVSRKPPARASMNCPDENIWFDVAGGRVSPAESLTYIQHAATCASCAQKLRTANRIFEDELSAAEESTINFLPSSNPDRQRELAEMLGKVSKAQEDKKGLEVKQTLRIPWRRLLLYAIPATACVIVGLLVSNSIGARRRRRR